MDALRSWLQSTPMGEGLSADVLTGMAQGTASGSGQTPALEPGVWELTGLSVDIMEPVVAEADVQFAEARAALLPHASAA